MSMSIMYLARLSRPVRRTLKGGNMRLPALVMTISVPMAWNLVHRSFWSRMTLGSSTTPSSSMGSAVLLLVVLLDDLADVLVVAGGGGASVEGVTPPPRAEVLPNLSGNMTTIVREFKSCPLLLLNSIEDNHSSLFVCLLAD